MKAFILALLLLVNSAWADDRKLSAQDFKLYEDIYKRCAGATYGGAISVSFDPEVVVSAATNLSKIMMLNVNESARRWNSGMMSPELYRKRHSDGFWWALVDCYAESSFGKKLLIKGIIDLGHLGSEVVGTLGSLYFMARLGEATAALHSAYPNAARFVVTLGISNTVAKQFNSIREEYFAKPTPQQEAQIKAIESNMYKNVNETMSMIQKLAESKIAEIELKLKDQNLPNEDRRALEAKREALKAKLAEISRTAASAS